MLQVSNVKKVFETGREAYVALDGLSLTIETGEFICLLGPSGCGKSTLLNILAGFEPVTSGRVVVDDVPVTGAGRDRVMFFQDASAALLPWLTVEENMQFALRVRKIEKREWPTLIDKYLHMVSLELHRAKFPSELSGGMRQRLQIARALVVEPKVLLMDEPFAALDALTRRHMHNVLLGIWQRTGKTVVFVTHDISEAILLGDRVAVMSVGPGSTITDLVKLAAPRPRDLADPSTARTFKEIEAMLAPDLLKLDAIEAS